MRTKLVIICAVVIARHMPFLTSGGPSAMFAQAQQVTSLYIPGFDPQPVSADIVGVGADGSTTWALHQGRVDPTDTSVYPDFPGTATLVQGSTGVFLTYANAAAQFTIGQSCSFSESTLALCTIVAQGSTATQTDFVTYLPIQGGASVSRSPSSAPLPITTAPSTTGPTTHSGGTATSNGSNGDPSQTAPPLPTTTLPNSAYADVSLHPHVLVFSTLFYISVLIASMQWITTA